MDNSRDLVLNSLNYYDKNNMNNEKIYKKFNYYTINRSDNDLDHSTIHFFDKNKQLIFKSRYEVIGVYNVEAGFWTWGWAAPSLKKNYIQIVRKLLNYGLDLEPGEDGFFLKAELITSRFQVTNDIQLDIHVAIASYLSKKPMIYKLIRDPELIEQTVSSDLNPLSKKEKGKDTVYYLYLLDG